MAGSKGGSDMMAHDPLADVDELSSCADDLLGDGQAPVAPPDHGSAPVVASLPEAPAGAAAGLFDLGSTLTIREAAETHERLLQALLVLDRNEFVLVAGELQQVDGAGLQMLVALAQELERRSVSLRWQGVSDALAEGAVTMGLAGSLGLS